MVPTLERKCRSVKWGRVCWSRDGSKKLNDRMNSLLIYSLHYQTSDILYLYTSLPLKDSRFRLTCDFLFQLLLTYGSSAPLPTSEGRWQPLPASGQSCILTVIKSAFLWSFVSTSAYLFRWRSAPLPTSEGQSAPLPTSEGQSATLPTSEGQSAPRPTSECRSAPLPTS